VEHLFTALNPRCTPAQQLTALLHDAAEYVIGDMISPFKHALGIDYKAFEARLEEAIHLRYGLPPKMPPSLKKKIKQCDLYCAWFEATQIAGFDPVEADQFFIPPPRDLTLRIKPLPVKDAERAFLDRFAVLNQCLEQTQ
jgi:5'-deoxynucleotidase YfbR-like HD superfamily hydrolase